jgi:hypothetical protein
VRIAKFSACSRTKNFTIAISCASFIKGCYDNRPKATSGNGPQDTSIQQASVLEAYLCDSLESEGAA